MSDIFIYYKADWCEAAENHHFQRLWEIQAMNK